MTRFSLSLFLLFGDAFTTEITLEGLLPFEEDPAKIGGVGEAEKCLGSRFSAAFLLEIEAPKVDLASDLELPGVVLGLFFRPALVGNPPCFGELPGLGVPLETQDLFFPRLAVPFPDDSTS